MIPDVDLAAVAREHLPHEMAERWIGLLRPGIRLDSDDADGLVVGHLGGEPDLPDDVAWPEWPDHGPLSFIAAIDGALIPPSADVRFPADGTLLFFYFDGQYDDAEALVIFDDPGSQAGARVLYIPAGTVTSPRATPAGITPYPRVPLGATSTATAPGYDHFSVYDAFPEMDDSDDDHPVQADDFVDALDFGYYFGHQLGGYALPVQGPVEVEVAHVALGRVDWQSPDLNVEARRWRLLAQIDSDSRAAMSWGDAGMLYWLIKDEDLEACRFDRALFTWQCG